MEKQGEISCFPLITCEFDNVQSRSWLSLAPYSTSFYELIKCIGLQGCDSRNNLFAKGKILISYIIFYYNRTNPEYF